MDRIIREYFNPTIYVLIVLEALCFFYYYKRVEDMAGASFTAVVLLSFIALLEIELFSKAAQYLIVLTSVLALILQIVYALY